MEKVCDLADAELAGKRQEQQETDLTSANSSFLPRTLNLERRPVPTCDFTTTKFLDEGLIQGSVSETSNQEGLWVSFETLTALDTDGPNASIGSGLSPGECLPRQPSLNEHFNNRLPRESQHKVSRTEVTDGGIGRTLGSSSQEPTVAGPSNEYAGSMADECPICTETYHSHGDRRMALLNCDHTMCQHCLARMLSRAADCSRVQCPLCRQKTPLLQFEIYRLQEDTALLTSSPELPAPMLLPDSESTVGRGLCAALEERLLLRAETARVCGCFEHPRWLVQTVRRMRRRCRCCYMALLVMMFLAELSFLALIFLPVVVLVLLFTLAR